MKTNSVTLKDGVTLRFSTLARSGYAGSCLSPAWTLDLNKPFVAHAAKTEETDLGDLDTAPSRSNHHLGHYADSREAAYVSERFYQDPLNFKLQLEAVGGEWVDFPSDLYDQPVFVTKAQAVAFVQASWEAKKTNTNRVVKVSGKLPFRVAFPNRSVNDNKGVWPKLYELYDGKSLFEKYGNEVVLRAKKYLTPQEFVNLFDLEGR